MADINYYIFGVGLTTDDLFYIGWTQRSPEKDKAKIISELVERGHNEIFIRLGGGACDERLSIFELETVGSVEDAADSATFWCQYYRSIGLDVITDYDQIAVRNA